MKRHKDEVYHYHLMWNDPIEPNWPNGAWSVYRITGDQIADRIVREEIVPADKAAFGVPHYRGPVIARHSWCGYLGMSETFDGAQRLIEKDKTA